jgi:hypothetical protein
MPFGGQNKADIFRVKVNTGGTAYELRQVDGTTVASAFSHACLRLNKTVTTNNAIDDSGIPNPTWDQDVDNKKWLALLKAVAKPSSGGSAVGERVYEDGVKNFGASGASSELVCILVYGQSGDSADDTANNIKCKAYFGTIPPSCWSDTQVASATSAPQAKLIGKITEFELDLTDVIDPNVITIGEADFKIPAGEAFVMEWLPAAA